MSRPNVNRLGAIGAALALTIAGAITHAAAPPSPGIYFEAAGKTGEDARIKLRSVNVRETKQTGLGKMMLTGGLLKGSVFQVIAGASATVRVPAGEAVFDFYLDPKDPASMQTMNPMDAVQQMMSSGGMGGAGDSMPWTAKKAEEFILVRLKSAEDTRAAQFPNAVGAHSKDEVKCAIEKIGDNAYRVRPTSALAPGEYAFTYSPQGGPGSPYWDFGVDAR
jgi:hypothetical protein